MQPTRSGSETLDGELVAKLRARGQRVTSQRLVIHRVLRGRATHMSAEEVHRECAATLPGVSLPTVYSALELLAELGLARRIDAGTGTALFDGRLDPHHHAVCRACGRIEDLGAAVDTVALAAAARSKGYHVDALQALASGLCRDCARSVSSTTSGGASRRTG